MLNVNDVVDSLVEVTLPDEEAFLKIKETLTRIGISSRKENKLWQSCHILHKRGKYYIVHFKELFILDGKESSVPEDDIARRNRIVQLLEEWGLVNVVDKDKIKDPCASIAQIKILPFAQKDDWILEAKYNIGKKIDEQPKIIDF